MRKFFILFILLLFVSLGSGEIYKKQVQEDLWYISDLSSCKRIDYGVDVTNLIQLNKEVMNLTEDYTIKNIIPISGSQRVYRGAAGVTLAYWVFVEEKNNGNNF